VKKLLSAGVLSLLLLAGSAFAYSGQYWNHDWDGHHRRHARVVRVFPERHDRGLHRGWYKHRRVRIINGRRVVVVRYPRHVNHVYYDRHVRMP